MEVFTQRLEQEFNAQVIVTAPSVPYKIIVKESKNRSESTVTVSNPSEWVDRRTGQTNADYLEPRVKGTIIAPADYLPAIMELCNNMVKINYVQKNFKFFKNDILARTTSQCHKHRSEQTQYPVHSTSQ